MWLINLVKIQTVLAAFNDCTLLKSEKNALSLQALTMRAFQMGLLEQGVVREGV